MKTTCIVSNFVLAVSYPAGLALQAINVLPFDMPSLPIFIGAYVATSLLAFAFADYSRGATTRARSTPPPRHPVKSSPEPVQFPAPTTTLRAA